MASNGSQTNGAAPAAAATGPVPLRLIVLVGGEEDAALKQQVFEGISKDKTDVIVRTRVRTASQNELRRGRVVVAETKTLYDAVGIAKTNKRSTFTAAFIQCGASTATGEEKLSLFTKQFAAKSSADVAGVVAQVREELFGKNAVPISVKPQPAPKVVLGRFEGEIPAEELKKVFEAFGKLAEFSSAEGKCTVTFEDPQSGANVMENAEISVAGVSVKLSRGRVIRGTRESTGAKPRERAPQKSQGASAGGELPPTSYLKIEDVPTEVDLQSLKEVFSKFDEKINVDLNSEIHHAILRTYNAAAAEAILKAKVVVKGSTLKIVTYQPKGGSKKKSRKSKGERSAEATSPSGPQFRVVVEGADPEKCTSEQLQKLFGGFQGLLKIGRTRDQKLLIVSYDNADSTQEILSAKEISCAGCKLAIRPFEERSSGRATSSKPAGAVSKAANAQQSGQKRERKQQEPRVAVPNENVLVVLSLPAEVTPADLAPLFQSIDAAVKVRVNSKSATAFVEFSSAETCKQALAKDIKYGDQLLKKEQKAAQVKISTGVFAKGVTREQESKLKEALKSVAGEPTAMWFGATGARVGLKTQQDVEAALAAKMSLDGSPLTLEALRS